MLAAGGQGVVIWEDLPVSVKDWMSNVRSMFTLSAFSTFLKMIPINHIERKSFLSQKNKTQLSCLKDIELYSQSLSVVAGEAGTHSLRFSLDPGND